MQGWLDDNAIIMYSIHNEGIPVIAERSIEKLKANIYKQSSSFE